MTNDDRPDLNSLQMISIPFTLKQGGVMGRNREADVAGPASIGRDFVA
jgi:hypothetical protein